METELPFWKYFGEKRAVGQCDQKIEKILPTFLRKWPEILKISTPKLALKAQIIHIKLLLKPSNIPWVESACLGEKLVK